MRRFYRLQMKEGSQGTTVAQRFLNINRITADLEYSGEVFDHLTSSDIILVHTGAYPLALVSIVNKVPEDQLAEGSFGVDYNIEIISRYSDLDETTSSRINIYGNCPPTGTFSAINPGNETYNRINRWFNLIQETRNMEDKIELLKFKKQIILQGPPGTGKTRLAKELASKLALKTEISNDIILKSLYVGQEIVSSTQKTKYKILSLKNDHLVYNKLSTDVPGRLNY